MTETETNLYNVTKENLGVHLTLNPNVSPEVGCAECLSKLLSLAGIPVPRNGIASTASFLTWALANPDLEEIFAPEEGAIGIAATGTGNGLVEGHCVVFGAFGIMYVDDWGLCSNDSNTGTLREQWSWKKFVAYYQIYGGITIRLFRVK